MSSTELSEQRYGRGPYRKPKERRKPRAR